MKTRRSNGWYQVKLAGTSLQEVPTENARSLIISVLRSLVDDDPVMSRWHDEEIYSAYRSLEENGVGNVRFRDRREGKIQVKFVFKDCRDLVARGQAPMSAMEN